MHFEKKMGRFEVNSSTKTIHLLELSMSFLASIMYTLSFTITVQGSCQCGSFIFFSSSTNFQTRRRRRRKKTPSSTGAQKK